MKAVVTEHHYNDISGAAKVLADEGIELVVGNCRTEDDAIALGRDADAAINQHVPITARVFAGWPRCRGVVPFGKGVDKSTSRSDVAHWAVNVRDANWDEVLEPRLRRSAGPAACSCSIATCVPAGGPTALRCRAVDSPDKCWGSLGSATSVTCWR